MKITSVKQGSTAEKLGVKSGDQLLRINSKRVKDEIDFRFRVTEEDILLEFRINGKLKNNPSGNSKCIKLNWLSS